MSMSIVVVMGTGRVFFGGWGRLAKTTCFHFSEGMQAALVSLSCNSGSLTVRIWYTGEYIPFWPRLIDICHGGQ